MFASINAGIGEELIFRLFFISFGMWFVWLVILKKYAEPIFWNITSVSGLIFGIGHTPAVMTAMRLATVDQLPTALFAEMILLNGALSIAASWLFRKYGFLAAIGIRFWTDTVWHVIYGFLKWVIPEISHQIPCSEPASKGLESAREVRIFGD